MTIIFKAKTIDGYIFKVLSELLHNNIKNACFKISETGISMCQMDIHRTILIDLTMVSSNFQIYKFKNKDPILAGVNMNHFYRMLKMIKKKDTVQLSIDGDNPTDLCIKVIPKDNNRITTSYIKIQDIQNIEIDVPDGYDKPIIIPSGEFQKMSKELSNISETINVSSKKFSIVFKCDADGIMKRTVEFGEHDYSDDDDSESDCKEYTSDFKTRYFTKIMKLAGMSRNLQIFPKTGLPLLFRSRVGSLGSISIYIKSTQDINNETGP